MPKMSIHFKLNAVFVLLIVAVSIVEYLLFHATVMSMMNKGEVSFFSIVNELGFSGLFFVSLGLICVGFGDIALRDIVREINSELRSSGACGDSENGGL